MAVEPPPGPWHRLPILVTGEGETVAKAVGAAEAAAWKALNEARRPVCEHAWSRREIASENADDSVGKHEWHVCTKCGRTEARPRSRDRRQVEMDLEAGK